MTSDEIAAIRARAEQATAGEWFWNSYSAISSAPLVQTEDDAPGYPETKRPGPPFFTPEDNAWLAQRAAAYEADSTVAWVPAHYGDTATGRHAADAEFIAHSRQDVPRLLDALEAAQAEVARLRAALREVAEFDNSGDDPYYSSSSALSEIARAALDGTAEAVGE